jgi:hypothetical protein
MESGRASARSLTEYITNQTILSSTELESVLPQLVQPEESLPHSILPTFLHEATHHWCFSSLVGTTLSLLALRGRLRALQAIEATSSHEREGLERSAAEYLTRADVTRELLKPLAEGLATFAEFDAMPTLRAPAIPAPLRWAVQMCARNVLTLKRDTVEWVSRRNDATMKTVGALLTARAEWGVRDRRIDMLQQPLSCCRAPLGQPSRGKEGYLAGYLTVKNFWRRVVPLSPTLELSDFYLLFLYEYFYEDATLSRLLLDGTLRAPESLAPITYHMRDRLLEPVDKATVQEFCGRMMDTRSAAHANDVLLFPSHASDMDPVLRARAMWADVVGERADFSAIPSGASARFALFSQALTDARDLLYVGSLDVVARVGRDVTTLELPQGKTVSVQTDLGAPQGTFTATVIICVGTRSGRHVVYVISRKKTLLALQVTPAAATRDEHIRVRRAVLGREAAELCNFILISEQPHINKLRELSRVDGYVNQTTDLLDGIYEPAALITVPEEVLEEAIIKTRHNGIYGLLDERDDLVLALAIMRRGVGLVHNRETLEREFKDEGLDLSVAVHDLQAYAEKFRLFEMYTECGLSCTL